MEVSWWRGVAIVCGWLGAGLLVTSTALVMREPHFVRAMGGLEAAYRWHHRAGVLAYLALLAHPIALALDGRTESSRAAWQALTPWTQAWPVWLGWFALLLVMIGLATTFSVLLPYRYWRKLHLLLGLSVLLSLAHVWALSGDHLRSIGLVATGLLALSWRLIVSDRGLTDYPYRVVAVTRPAAGMIEASLAPCAGTLALEPGQFVLAAFGHGPRYEGCGEYHPFTVSGIDAGQRLRLTVKALGSCSQRLQALEPGVLVRLQGPFGNFLSGTPGSPELWIAGGIGITPFMAALRAQPRTQSTMLIYLYRSIADAAFLNELDDLAAADPLLELVTVATGDRLPNVDTLISAVHRLSERRVYLCGPRAMVEALVPQLVELGVSRRSIRFELFDFRER
ncbi:ferredoxin reductase family protein [Paraburkholderia sp. A3BS-1L]|uniref:ferric reductase-like transmembrane domain-containing protein n=1 Tax=Paraburkholderia sp. A3BS-1L TaxID=3028375 RepID=UPI003DAA467D